MGMTDEPGGWRRNKVSGGVVLDVDADAVVVGGLSMPHSPRWYGNALWILNSGTGELLMANPETGEVRVVCGLPGYVRGLSFVGPHALVGMCKIREKHIFGGMPVQERFAQTPLRRGGCGPSHGNYGGYARFFVGLRGTVRRAVPARHPPRDDPQFGEAGGASSRDDPKIVVLAAA